MRLLIVAAAAVLLLLQVLAAGATRTEPLVGGWEPIKNLNDPYVQEIAKFAIKTHNDQAKTGLVLEKVVKGETQVVAGTNYKLVVAAKDGADTKNFEAVVWDKPWEHFRSLTSFKPV
ncbi:cysteine proteinase inhibitor 1-like [Eucalyptus grandis]|uniref:cysteine proteinase inhibitor 1-like n=1 Tax=Eucalyptus grandis TaxID=71139 RepID=UPI00192E9C60|nr:cysteine proteinase inhibitor 1-like [Eucalyptus grandis]